jgi:uncharacterized protein YndB with AHSA1/START domain
VALGDAVIRGLIRLGLVGASVGYAVDRLLGETARSQTPEPIRSMVVVDAPIERVWAVLADIEGQTRWMHDMKAVRILTDGPVGVGTVGEADVRIFGIGVTDPVTITEFQPPTRFALTHDGTFKGSGVFELEPGADGTTTIVRWDETLIPPLLPNLGAAIGSPLLASIFQADLERLRDLVEAEMSSPILATGPAVATDLLEATEPDRT